MAIRKWLSGRPKAVQTWFRKRRARGGNTAHSVDSEAFLSNSSTPNQGRAPAAPPQSIVHLPQPDPGSPLLARSPESHIEFSEFGIIKKYVPAIRSIGRNLDMDDFEASVFLDNKEYSEDEKVEKDEPRGPDSQRGEAIENATKSDAERYAEQQAIQRKDRFSPLPALQRNELSPSKQRTAGLHTT
ncbi:hypothetical protein N0V90_012325 [Kalmusia sp. IMI 367209]|nr:hypothetical protein N0V90_012325 [Kalmusia sp. IMI 367209]